MDRPNNGYQYILNAYHALRSITQLFLANNVSNEVQHDMTNELLSGVRLKGLDYRRIDISE